MCFRIRRFISYSLAPWKKKWEQVKDETEEDWRKKKRREKMEKEKVEVKMY